MILNLKDAFNRVHQISDEVVKEIIIYILSTLNHNLVNKEEFNELKEIVKNIAIEQQKLTEEQRRLTEAQKRTEEKVEQLAEAQNRTEERLDRFIETTEKKFNELTEEQRRLAEAQKKTEERLNELAEAQKKTEERLNELAEAQKKTDEQLQGLIKVVERTNERVDRVEQKVDNLEVGLSNLRKDVGGLAKSVSYALENEAYRYLPKYLKEKHGIELKERIIRTEIEGEEINLYARGIKEGREVVIIGESTLKLDNVKEIYNLERKVEVVGEVINGAEVIKIIITHYAKKGIKEIAEKEGVLVIQSFEWDI